MAGRIMMEWVCHPFPSYFVTLTYDDDHVPRTLTGDPTLERKRIQKWFQNRQADCGQFRYFLVGEYGERYGRPHYHVAIFPGPDCRVELITDKWTRGFSSTYPMAEGFALYMLKDLTKGYKKRDSELRAATGQEAEFRTGSRKPPIGAAFISVLVSSYSTSAGKAVLERDGDIGRTVRFGGTVLPIHRYILTKVRERLGIPRLHEERMAHPGYFAKYCAEEYAEWQPDEALAEEISHHAKEKAKALRKTARRL